jgi:hypothetical protein
MKENEALPGSSLSQMSLFLGFRIYFYVESSDLEFRLDAVCKESGHER